MKTAKDVLKAIKDNDVKYVDLRFTDPRGKWQHVTFDVSMINEDAFAEGMMFDGSSIAGWKAINESDMALMPDPTPATSIRSSPRPRRSSSATFSSRPPASLQPRPARDRQEGRGLVKSTGIGDTVFVGPEAEFFIFDDVKLHHRPTTPASSSTRRAADQFGHRVRGRQSRPPHAHQGRLLPGHPAGLAQDMRSEMLSAMAKMGVTVEKHHHEVAPAQHELGMKFAPLVTMADQMQIYKYCIHNVAHVYGKTATFMPKPVYGDNGSGMHVHQSIWKDGKPLFAGNKYADLSQECLWYIGGIIKHAKAINAFTNPSTNSYKRLVPGYEAPVLLAYSARNRSPRAAFRTTSPKAKRVEVRFPDPMANPYLAFAADADGRPRRHPEQDRSPGEAMDKDLYDLPPAELKKIPTVCGSLREALERSTRTARS